MRPVNLIGNPTETEFKMITRMAGRIIEALRDLIPQAEHGPEFVQITVDDFRGLQLFSLDLSLTWGVIVANQRELIAKRRGCSLRDVWVYGGEGVSRVVFGCERFDEDAEALRALTDEWTARGMCEVEQVYHLWSVTLSAAISAKPNTPLRDLPWIIESGLDDFVPKACAIALNPNGEAHDYLKEVWGVE